MIACQSRSIRTVGEGGEKGRSFTLFILVTLPRFGLRKEWCAACGLVSLSYSIRCSDSNAISVSKSRTDSGDSMCHNDLVRNSSHRPVLKHGPRSLTSMQVFE